MYPVKLGKENVYLNTLILNPEAKETILMVHGMFGNIAQFYFTIAPELSKDFKIILFDLRGHGKSTRTSDGYTLSSLANDIKCLLDALKIEQCHILGFSFGTLIALKFTMEYKGRVKKVVAMDIPPKATLPEMLKDAYSFDNFLDFASTLPSLVHKNFMRSDRQLRKNFEMYKHLYNSTSFVDDLNRDKNFTEADYRSINAPVLLLFGQESACISELMRVFGWIKNKVIQFEEGGHNFFSDRPVNSAEKIRNFLLAAENDIQKDITSEATISQE
jgi:esterase